MNSSHEVVPRILLDRRSFVLGVGAGVAAAGCTSLLAAAEKATPRAPESLVSQLHKSLTTAQRQKVCFDWNHQDKGGLLRLHVSNNWQITKPAVTSNFFTKDQQEMIEATFFGLYHPDWHDRIRKQLRDDAGGYGKAQSIAIFGQPDDGPFELVMTGRHLTIRCDGNSTPSYAFGGPIFYGHAAQSSNEKPDHPGNVFWPQALKANQLFEMLDGKQRKVALLPFEPAEDDVQFRRDRAEIPGLSISELSADQKSHLRDVLNTLVEPYREADRAEIEQCLQAEGGLENCRLSFYETGDLGEDRVWDNWRLEGPRFVWYFRGAPHVHVWVNVARAGSEKITTAG